MEKESLKRARKGYIIYRRSIYQMLVLFLMSTIFLPVQAEGARQELHYQGQSETNFIGGQLPRITFAQPWKETCDDSGCRYPFKLIFTRVSKDEKRLARQGNSDPVGEFMYMDTPSLREVLFDFDPPFGQATSKIFPVLKQKAFPPL